MTSQEISKFDECDLSRISIKNELVSQIMKMNESIETLKQESKSQKEEIDLLRKEIKKLKDNQETTNVMIYNLNKDVLQKFSEIDVNEKLEYGDKLDKKKDFTLEPKSQKHLKDFTKYDKYDKIKSDNSIFNSSDNINGTTNNSNQVTEVLLPFIKEKISSKKYISVACKIVFKHPDVDDYYDACSSCNSKMVDSKCKKYDKCKGSIGKIAYKLKIFLRDIHPKQPLDTTKDVETTAFQVVKDIFGLTAEEYKERLTKDIESIKKMQAKCERLTYMVSVDVNPPMGNWKTNKITLQSINIL